MVWVMVVVRVMVRVRVECYGLVFPPEPSKECVKVSHVIVECRVINHHPEWFPAVFTNVIERFSKKIMESFFKTLSSKYEY